MDSVAKGREDSSEVSQQTEVMESSIVRILRLSSYLTIRALARNQRCLEAFPIRTAEGQRVEESW